MLGQKITRNNMRTLFNNVKHGIHRGYHTTKKFLGDVDSGVRIAKELYTTLEPLISAVAGTHKQHSINNQVLHHLTNYESVRNKLMDADQHVGKYANLGNKVQNILGLN